MIFKERLIDYLEKKMVEKSLIKYLFTDKNRVNKEKRYFFN